MKRTKIICTIGPSSEKLEIIKSMIQAGMNVARLNFSHGTYDNHLKLIKNIRAASRRTGTPVAIMQDLQGPKIRVAELKEPLEVKTGGRVVLGTDLRLDFDISATVKKGECILIEDGLIALRIIRVSGKLITCEVENGGIVRSHKGVNLPDSRISFPVFTNKDSRDLSFGLKNDVDYVALSFVRGPEDIVRVRSLIKKRSRKAAQMPRIVAKIERREAVSRLDEIIGEADALMVARGDLGVEMSDTEVPVVQKNIISKCLQAAKPVIVATQMLDSMIENPRPTRAEVSDVANAVIDKADCVMLSGETAYGKYPLQTVKEMAKIINATEESPYVLMRPKYASRFQRDGFESRAAAIAESVYDLAEHTGARAIIGTTESGFTARFVSHQRPDIPIIILTDRPKIYRQMCMMWGVFPLFVRSMAALKDIDALLKYFIAQSKRMKLVVRGDKAVLVAGNPLGQRMNLVEVVTIN